MVTATSGSPRILFGRLRPCAGCLESNPSRGYSWELAGPLDEAIVTSLGSDHEAADGDAVGAPGTQDLSFKAVGAGTTTIALQYVRPWETDVAPAETKDYAVNVSG